LTGRDERGATQLLGYGRCALLVGRVEHVAIELVDRRLLAAAVVADVAGIVCRRDGGRVGYVDCRQPCGELPDGRRIFFSEQSAGVDNRYRDAAERIAAGVAV